MFQATGGVLPRPPPGRLARGGSGNTVALNKRKILDAAQKYLQKGSLDRALKEYQKVVDADPRDTNVRLKVGDVLLRQGRNEEAIQAYRDVAERFMKDGFDAKAVALFKQITKIDPKRYEIYEPLAELYQRLGLSSEAMSTLQAAAEAHQREGRKKEGLALLRKMASLDPSNTATRIKIAELLWKEGLQDEAFAEYDEVVAELGRQGDHEGTARVHEQVLGLAPGRLENLVGHGCALLDMGRPEAAEPPLLKATEVAVESVEAWETLARVQEALGRGEELESTWKTVAAIYRDRGNEERAKEILQLYVTPEGFGDDDDDEEGPRVERASQDLSGEGDPDVTFGDAATPEETQRPKDAAAPAAAPELEIGGGGDVALEIGDGASGGVLEAAPELELDDEIEIELDEEVGEAAPAAATVPHAETEADPAQLLAEAGVYLRYSQHDKAVACLEQILEREPTHCEALAKLGEARRALGDAAAAVDLWRRAATGARGAGVRELFDTLCSRIRELDVAAADALASEAAPAPATPAPDLGAAPEIDLDAAPDIDLETAPAADADASPDAEAAPELDLDVDVDVDVDEILETTGAEVAPAPAADETAGARAPGGGTSQGQIAAEDLEEAEFYFRQGLYEEAEQILRRLLAQSPGHPQVLLRLGEIARERGESPSSAMGGEVDFDTTEDTSGEEAAGSGVPPAPPVDERAAFADDDEAETAAAFDAGEDLLSDDTVEDWDAEPGPEAPPAGPDDRTLQADTAGGAAEEDVSFGDEASDAGLGADSLPDLDDTAAETSAPGEGFDLAAELSSVFDEDPEVAGGEPTTGGTTQAGFESIFQSFKQGVKETLGDGEHETHYDLGIAYREMGLFEDAISEFRVAIESPARQLDCLALMGLCALDLGRAGDAVGHLEQALAMPGLDEARLSGLRFDLGRAFELQGDLGRARAAWEQVLALDADFPEVKERLAGLGQADEMPSLGELDPDLSGDGEVFESFDDLIAEAEADGLGGGGDDDDDPDGPEGPGGGPGDPDPDDRDGPDDRGNSADGMSSTQWGRKVSYG